MSEIGENVLNNSNMPLYLGTYSPNWNNLSSFNRFKNFEVFDSDVNGYGYVFFTRPEMNLNNPDFDTRAMNKVKHYFDGMGFMYPLTNYAQSFELTDTVLKTDTYVQTVRGYKMVKATDYIDSMTEGSFSITYKEDSDLTVLNMHKYWVDYIHKVRFGDAEPNPKAIATRNRPGFIDYVSSVYYFKVAPDGFTIKYYAKYTGVIPTNIPYSSQNWNAGEIRNNSSTSYSYAFSFKHDMEPWILEDFNEVTKRRGLFKGFETSKTDMRANWCPDVGVMVYAANDQIHYALQFR